MPENRNSGVIPNRQIELNDEVSRWVDMYAAIGPANASAVSVPTGTTSTMPGVAAAPNSTMTSMKMPPTRVARVAIQARRPAAIEYGEIGVAYIAWNRRIQWNPARTGNVASNTEPCMTVDTSRAGASHWRYDTPPSACAPLPAST